jgi:uncharacterized protein (TIGR00299 family) protein
MRKILYLEPIGGIAGDMFLAAAVDLGVSPKEIGASLAGLRVPGWKLSTARATRHAISGTHLDVVVEAGTVGPGQRSLRDIRTLIEGAQTLSPRARERAIAVFQRIGEAEAKIHNVPIEQIHFHEVGAVDSIVDICGAAVALDLLGDPEVYAAPPPLGSGAVRVAHGNLPIPPPATLEILRGLPVRFEGVGELTTPTGAALLRTLCRIAPPPEFVLERVGYGIGSREMADRPNVLRASLGTLAPEASEATYVIEANLDDCSPQILGELIERLISLGALDVYVLPATMKKGRPGHLFGALASAAQKDAVIQTLLSESTTIGLRFHRVERTVLERRFEEVKTSFGPVRIKVATLNGVVMNAQPEFDDCRALAEKHRIPLKRVWAEALALYHRPGG